MCEFYDPKNILYQFEVTIKSSSYPVQSGEQGFAN